MSSPTLSRAGDPADRRAQWAVGVKGAQRDPKGWGDPPQPRPQRGRIKGAKGWSDPPQLFADPEMPELTQREGAGKNKETPWGKNRILQEQGQGHSGCKYSAHPLLHSTTQAPRQLPAPQEQIWMNSQPGSIHGQTPGIMDASITETFLVDGNIQISPKRSLWSPQQWWELGSVPGRELCQLCCGHPASTGHSALHPVENSSSNWRRNLFFQGK